MTTSAVKAQYIYLDKIIFIQRQYRNLMVARDFTFRMLRQYIDRERAFLYDQFNKKKDTGAIAKKIVKKSPFLNMKTLDDMIKIYMNYK